MLLIVHIAASYRPSGRLSEDQQRIADHMRRAGHRFEVVDSVEAAISVLVVWGGR
jgi:hypothetical protein